jgi:putative ABC transport system permease protein
MSTLKGLVARARSLVARRAAEARMEEEFAFHLAMEARRLEASGVPHHEALRRARVAFGGVDRHREEMRDGRGGRLFADFAADIRYAARTMRRAPGFAVAVALTLGVGIGVNGIMFGFVDSMLFRPLPVHDPNRLVGVFTTDTRTGQPGLLAYDDYLDFRDRSGVFDGLAGSTGVPLNLVAGRASGDAAADMVWGELVTENYFTVLGMAPVVGRFFTAEDARRGTTTLAVISYESWRRRFHADTTVIGRVVRINGADFTIVGVAPPGFKGTRTFGFWPEMWVPMAQHEVALPGSRNLLQGRGGGWLYTFGRMHPAWTRPRTERAAAQFASQLARTYPATDATLSVMLIDASTGFDHPAFVKPAVLALGSLMGIFAAAITLLVICANLANVQLARASTRAHEIAIRLSLGCSRWRLVRQLLAESLLLAAPGAVLALAIIRLTPLLESHLVPHLQFQVGIGASPDLRVALLTTLATVFAIALFGLVPALRASRPGVAPTAATVIGARRGGSIGHRASASNLLVVAQLAMSVVLLVGGMLFVRSLYVARGIDLGFDARDRAMLSVNVGLQRYDESRGRRFYDDVLTRVRALPGVESAAWAFPVPFDTYGRGLTLYVPGAATNTKEGTIGTNASVASDGVVQTLGMRLQTGRDLSPADSGGAPRVMIVSRSLAARLWPGRDPIGQRARLGDASGPEVTVVGVTADATFSLIGESSKAHAFLPLRQNYRDWQTLIVHTRGPAGATLPTLRATVTSLDPMLPTFGAMTMEQNVASGLATPRMAASISGFFAVLALFIAAVGLYAVVAGSVTARTREIGVRLALGATPLRVLQFVMERGARLGLVGLVIGLVAAALVAKLMSGLLYGLSPSDWVTFTLAPVCLTVVVVVATYLPARRAVKLDPVRALRSG